ncbi:MAG: hypothetical protein ACRBEQ_13795, partial [Hyphomonas sp.]
GKELVSMMGQELIQKLGTEMGLPQSMIDAAQAAFCKECGDMQGYKSNHLQAGHGFHINRGEELSSKVFLQHILNGFDASPAQRGNAERAFEAFSDGVMEIMNDLIRGSGKKDSGKANKGDSLLVALAKALGGAIDDKLDRMYDLSMELKNMEGKDKGYGSKSAELSAVGQEMKILSEALSNSIKSIGESGSTLARKQ